jgi:hypothetical protein
MPAFIANYAPSNEWQYADANDITDTTAVEVKAAPGANKRHRVVAVQLTNTDTAVGTVVQVLSGASTVLANLWVGPYVAAAPGGAGQCAIFPLPLRATANEAIQVKCVTTSAQVRCSVQGYTETC